MKRIKNLFTVIATAVIFITVFLYMLLSGNLLSVIKNVAVTGGLNSIPGGVYSSPATDVSLSKALTSGVFSAVSFSDNRYNYTFPEQSFSTPYFKKGSESSETFPVSTVTLQPASSSGYISLKNILIKDSSTKNPDMNDIFEKALDLELKKADSGPQVLILHTHATESYNLDNLSYYKSTTSFRTDDITKNVVAVGNVIEETLKENGISVIHAEDLHDKESYNGAYGRSLETAKKYLQQYPTIKVILDVHRDSIITSNGTSYRPVSSINGTNAAQIMFVIGTGTTALPNDNWKNNLRFAVAVQERLTEAYSGLCRPMILRDSRYNMNLSKGYMLVETGSSGNTLEEAKYSAGLFGKALADELNENLK